MPDLSTPHTFTDQAAAVTADELDALVAWARPPKDGGWTRADNANQATRMRLALANLADLGYELPPASVQALLATSEGKAYFLLALQLTDEHKHLSDALTCLERAGARGYGHLAQAVYKASCKTLAQRDRALARLTKGKPDPQGSPPGWNALIAIVSAVTENRLHPDPVMAALCVNHFLRFVRSNSNSK